MGSSDEFAAQREAERKARDLAWGDGVYDAWKGYAPDPHHLGRGPEDAYHDGYEALS